MNDTNERIIRASHFREVHRIAIDDSKFSQKKLCLAYLKEYGSITPLEALNAFDCFRLASVINRLRCKDGYVITTTINANGKGYAIYTLIPDGEEQ